MRPWLFVPEKSVPALKQKLEQISNGEPPKFDSKITYLEHVQPWYSSAFNRNAT
jgi:hypothetical protein